MDDCDCQALKALLPLLREHGVRRFKWRELEVELGAQLVEVELPLPAPEPSKAPVGFTDEDLFYSAGGASR